MKFTVIRAGKTAGFLLLATFANPLMAQTTTDYGSGWYMGGNIGISAANIDKDKITQNLTNPSYTDDESDLGYKLFGGYQFNKYFALEGGYFNLGMFDYALSTGTGTAAGNIKIMGVNLDAVAILPVTENFSVFGRAGANYARAKDSFSTTGSISITDTNPKKSDLNYKFGVGLQYAITDAVGIRLEAERYRINDAVGNMGDIDLFSVGLTYRFGVTKEAAPVSEEKEAVAPVSEPEEVLVVVTAADAQEKIKETVIQKKTVVLVFQDIHFEFDKSTLNKEAKGALKRDISQLDKNTNVTMLVAGYASESGTEKYNQALSERRAESVKDYLIQEKFFPANKISTIGYGETSPALYEANPSDIHSKEAKANMRVLLKIIHK
ncbi:MAG: outer membrane beta-barrel protein [Sulfuricurvum sp.]|jgi:OOP family OmpA-OmpF porin